MPATPRTLATTVFITNPKTHQTLLLKPGTEVTDPALAGPDHALRRLAAGTTAAAPPHQTRPRDVGMTLTDADQAYLTSELGAADRTDLETRYAHLGSLPAVVMEILRERKAALIAAPLTVTAQGVAMVSSTENVKVIKRQIVAMRDQGTQGALMASPVPLIRPRCR
ncbi:hypothetical protein ABZV28_17640 [Streptomyces sp. NPDC004981]|uniref:hypothetical protein n=1 Tax=Streptomyces sp. NPDC004981 TaxID=3156655 RepID=UPI0033A9F9BB